MSFPTSPPALAILLDMTATHVPVLAGELIEALDPRPGQTAIDCTVGGAGHARLVAERLGSAGTLVAIDRDPLAQESFDRLAGEMACSARFLRMGYAEALALLAREGLTADIVYFDLGISSMQVDRRERGFSYSYDAPLDMRMDPDQQLSAREVVAEWDERRLALALRELGEERHAGAIARSIAHRRSRAPIETTLQLVDAISSALPAPARVSGNERANAPRWLFMSPPPNSSDAVRAAGGCSRRTTRKSTVKRSNAEGHPADAVRPRPRLVRTEGHDDS